MPDYQTLEMLGKHHNLLNEILGNLRYIRSNMATQPGLTALTQAESDLATAVANATAEIASLASQLATLTANSEDTQVSALAAQIETLSTNLQASVTSATTPAATAPVASAEVKKPA